MTGLDDRSHGARTRHKALGDAETPTDELVHRLADVTAEAVSSLAVVYLLSPESKNLRVGAWSHPSGELPAPLNRAIAREIWTIDGSLLGWPVTSGDAIFARNLGELMEASGRARDLGRSIEGTFLEPDGPFGVHSLLVAPLRLGDAVLGVLVCARRASESPFGRDDLDAVNELASRAATTLEQARLTAQLRATNDHLQEAIRLRDLFINIASHELKTPLGTMRLLVEMLRKGTTMASSLPADFVEEKGDEIGRQVDRMTKRVERLLDISRLTGGQIESLSLERFDLAELIADRLSTLRQTDPELTIEAHIDPDEPGAGIPGTWDRERMGQILDNLIQNARGDVDSDDGSATIVIEVEAQEQSMLGVPAVEMIVGDPDLRIDHESHPVELEDVVRQSRDEGIGWSCLGLWIVEQIVRVFGGELTVEEQPELGTCYRVTIPRDISPYVCEAAQ
jgi:signal transduction histidine kinase